MAYLVLGVALLAAFLLAAKWYVNAPPSTLVKAFKWAAVILVVLFVILVILTKNVLWLLFALPAILPWYLRARQAARMAKNWSRMSSAFGGGSGSAPGQTSEIETKYLRMYLDHESGEMNGDVVLGKFEGQTLRSLGLDQLLELLLACADDEESVQVLTAYLDRYHGDEWHDRAGAAGANAGGGGASSSAGMTRDEAFEILGLEEGASEDDIKEAHHRLMSKIHPDHGGSTYLATKINQAKDLLLGS